VRFGITANPRIPTAYDVAKRAATYLRGHNVVLEDDLAEKLGKKGVPLGRMEVDVVIAIGGDGTVLRALQRNEAPVLGVNPGSLGFLVEAAAKEMKEALARVARREHVLEERLKLRVDLDGRRLYDCTNEAVVHTAAVAKIRHFEVKVDDVTALDVRADGMILATPTGSTSYAMSTGGPLIDPRVEAIVITAIAPFKPSARPLVVPALSKVAVALRKPRECLLVLDGQHEVSLKGYETLQVTASERRARFVRLEKQDFYRRYEEKLAGRGDA
jgi:NAD+ kinase